MQSDEITGGVRDPEHWMRRVEHLLKRPATKVRCLPCSLDGTESGALVAPPTQGPAGGILCRPDKGHCQHPQLDFEDKLGRLRGLAVQPTSILVDVYDDAPGGELD